MNELLDLFIYIFLGMLQGVAEILPISSSGHLALFQALFGINQGSSAIFALLLHIGSLIALILFFYPVLVRLFVSLMSIVKGQAKETEKEDGMLILYLIIASIPAAMVGLFIKDSINEIFDNLWFTGIGFLVTAWMLVLLSRTKTKSQSPYTFKNTLITGLFQMIGIFPGVSRSGMTITGATLAGLPIKKAKEFSFLLFIPITLGSVIVSMLDGLSLTNQSLPLLIVSMIVAMIFTYLSLIFVFKKLAKKHFKYFSIYLVGMAILTFIVALQ
jgi:undecaprenyl-diphosphatase